MLLPSGNGPDGNPMTRTERWERVRDSGVGILAWVVIVAIAFWLLGHVVRALLLFVIAALLALQDKATAQFPPKDEAGNGGVELSFAADDVDATWQRWQQRGVTLVTEPADLPFGRYFMARDPEGYYLSVYRLAPQPATAPSAAGQGS